MLSVLWEVGLAALIATPVVAGLRRRLARAAAEPGGERALPDPRGEAMERIYVELRRGRRDAAIEICRAFLRREPGDPELSRRLGLLYAGAGRRADAARVLRELLDAHVAANRLEAAVREGRRLLALCPEDRELLGVVAAIDERRGDRAGALERLRSLAERCRAVGDPEGEGRALRRILHLDPGDFEGALRLADLHVARGERRSALEALRAGADTLLAAGRQAEWLGVLERMAALDPGNGPLACELGDALAARGHPLRALATLERAVEFGPGDPALASRRVAILAGLGRRADAVAVCRDLAAVLRRRGLHADADAWEARARKAASTFAAAVATVTFPQADLLVPGARDEAKRAQA